MSNVDTDELRSIRKDVGEIAVHMGNLVGKFESHIENQSIHQNPPCEAHKALSNKLWVIGSGAFTALLASAYNALKGQ